MEIIKGRTVVQDGWVTLDSQASLPEGADVIVPLDRWRSEGEALRARAGRVGVSIEPTDDVRALEGLESLSLVAVQFPKFADGRGYSQAWLLRNELGFGGAIRAVGDVLRDQLAYMSRCGFDEFAVRADKDIHDALKAFETYSVRYQETHVA